MRDGAPSRGFHTDVRKNTPPPTTHVFLKVLLDLKMALVLYVKSLASNVVQ